MFVIGFANCTARARVMAWRCRASKSPRIGAAATAIVAWRPWRCAFESWATEHGLPTDTNANGGTNLLRFGFGMVAGAASAPLLVDGRNQLVSTGMPRVHNIKTGSSFNYHAIFTRPKNWGALGLTYTAQFSGDLINWVSSTATPTTIASDTDNEAVTVSYPFLVNGKKALFFRIIVGTTP